MTTAPRLLPIDEKVYVAIDRVRVPSGRRPLGDLSGLMASIEEVGLLNPIVVAEDGTLIAGNHRLAACRQLGWTEIEAVIRGLSGVRRELAEIDENLIRSELTPLERADHLARRKAIYLVLHPETKRGAMGGRPSKSDSESETNGNNFRQFPKSDRRTTFAEDTAAKMGVTPRTVDMETFIGERLTDETKEVVRGTKVETNKSELLRLAHVEDKARQKEVAVAVATGVAANVTEALEDLGDDTDDAQHEGLMLRVVRAGTVTPREARRLWQRAYRAADDHIFKLSLTDHATLLTATEKDGVVAFCRKVRAWADRVEASAPRTNRR